MAKTLKIILAFIVSWMFFFPITFTFLPPSINSKMLMAILGVLFVVSDIIHGKIQTDINKSFIIILVIASIFSINCFLSVVYNNTDEYGYATYVISMLVWLGAAYAAFRMIGYAHGHNSIRLISNYIIALCAVQCIVALMIYYIPSLNSFFRHYTVIADLSSSYESRLYGIGTQFDVAGIRFAAALILCAAMIMDNPLDDKSVLLYLTSFCIIFILGNMMSRTTSVGAFISLLYLVFKSGLWKFNVSKGESNVLRLSFYFLLLTIPLLICLYMISYNQIRGLVDFGFEGIIHLMETGEWDSHSTSILQGMWNIWPQNFKTWIIGDGYFSDPNNPKLFYMGTDVGYARMIFYCGLLGLSAFVSFFVYLTRNYMKKFTDYSSLFFLLFILQLAVWCKVSTDIFFIYAFYYPIFCKKDKDLQSVAYEEDPV